MNFEPKKTNKAAFVALWHNNELLVLQSRKWRSEGTSYLLPGGGCKIKGEKRDGEILEKDESPGITAIAELWEETRISMSQSKLRLFGSHETQWSICTFFEREIHGGEFYISLENKMFGYEWWNFQEDRERIQALKPFMMPGLKWYLEQKGLL